MALERQEYTEISPWWGEHLHRYQEALKLVNANDIVLDIACGNGFGSSLLANATSGKVIGGDISEEAIAFSKQKFQKSNLEFAILDGTRLPFADNYFDKIVSFETIEHTVHYQKMINEFNRILKKDGLLILSTPNIIINSPSGKVTNPYHTQEFTFTELELIIKTEFEEFKIYGQKYSRYSNKSFSIVPIIETFFYLRGIRKIPIKIQDYIMKKLNGIGHYPKAFDYKLVEDINEIQKCKTFFVVAKKV